MKTTPAIFLLILYTLAVCKPILPLVHDEIAHVFWKAQHIATIHHHHGDHHAEEEVATAAHDEESNGVPAASKTSEPVSFHLILYNNCAIAPLLIEKQRFPIISDSASPLSLDKYFPPPKIS